MSQSRILLISRLSTQNAGNEALSKELIAYVTDRLPDADVRALDRYPRYFEQFRLEDLGSDPIVGFDQLADRMRKDYCRADAAPPAPAAIERVRLDETGRELTGPLRTLKRKLAVRRRLSALRLIERDDISTAVTACATSGLSIWNPAGEIHPTGCPDQVMRLLLLLRIAQLGGQRTAVINHSLEIANERLQRLIAHVYSRLDYVGVRDARSAEIARALTRSDQRVREAPDLVFLASRRRGEHAAEPVPEGAIAFGINGLEAQGGVDEWSTLMQGLKRFDRPFVFVSNAVNHDREFARRLAKRFGGSVVEHQPGYQTLRSYYRRCAVLISSRLHASILALCEDVPVVSIEPSMFKLTAIFQQLNYPLETERLQIPGWADRVLRKVGRCLSDRETLSVRGREALKEQTRRIDDAYAPLFALAHS